MTPALVTLLHLCDSLFPIGAFAHSDGLEAATASGRISTGDDFAHWLAATRDHVIRRCEGPAVARAWQAASTGDVDQLAILDGDVFAMRPSASGREAVRAMGTRLLRSWAQMYPAGATLPLFQRQCRLTLPVAFGVVCCGGAVGQRDAVAAYAYTRLASSLSAAMRLMPLGQQQGHALLAASLAGLPTLARDVVDDGRPLMAFTPAIDIAAMQHQYVHSRLFRS